MSWQAQEAKQRVREVLRVVDNDGTQTSTRYGEKIAVIDEIEAERKKDFPPEPVDGLNP
ncbi:MAG: hypothetical protein ACRDTC_04470 [Pseudonocardiaceae bacterium]